MLQGIPASGKSTWARALVLSDPMWKRVNRDEIRHMLHAGAWNKANEKLTKEVQMSTILNALSMGYNVIIDDTNCEPKHLRRVRATVSQAFPAVGWKTIRFNIELGEALARNAQRPPHERVPDHVIHRMWIQLNNYTPEI